MITIPVAAPNKLFQWQASLFQFAQKKHYGDDSLYNSKLAIVKQNNYKDATYNDVDWNLTIPYYMTEGIYSYTKNTEQYNIAINLMYSIKQILNTIHFNEAICIIDCDVIPLKRYTGPLPADDEVISCNFYEDWHMKMMVGKDNYQVIEPYLKHDEHNYIDGGFIPMIIRRDTLEKIIDEVIEVSLDVVQRYPDKPQGWWCAMFGFNVACHNHKIKMVSQNNCYFPHMNELDEQNHWFAHYSCDPKFGKGSFPNHNIKEFPNNSFYNTIREWMYR